MSTEKFEVGNLGSMREVGEVGVNLFITLLFIYFSYSCLQTQYNDTSDVPFCILQQLLKLTATNLKPDIGVHDSAAP